MRRRSRAGSERVKLRRKTITQKGRGLRNPSGTDHKPQSDVAQLVRERDEALEREKATAEVLRVISSSPGELQPVFKAMLENATRICGAKFGMLFRYEGGFFHLVASLNLPPLLADFMSREGTFPPQPGRLFGRLTETKSVIHMVDRGT